MDAHPSPLPDVLRHHGTRWQIRHDDQYNVWTALRRPTPASQRYVVAYDLPALAANSTSSPGKAARRPAHPATRAAEHPGNAGTRRTHPETLPRRARARTAPSPCSASLHHFCRSRSRPLSRGPLGVGEWPGTAQADHRRWSPHASGTTSTPAGCTLAVRCVRTVRSHCAVAVAFPGMANRRPGCSSRNRTSTARNSFQVPSTANLSACCVVRGRPCPGRGRLVKLRARSSC